MAKVYLKVLECLDRWGFINLNFFHKALLVRFKKIEKIC